MTRSSSPRPRFAACVAVPALNPPFTAKNVILAGVRALTIHDQKTVEVRDLSAQFYLTEEDVGQNRAEACKEKLQELNNAVDVSASSAQLSPDYLEQFQVRGVCAVCGVGWGGMGTQHNSGGGSRKEAQAADTLLQPSVCTTPHPNTLCFSLIHACRWWC